ncbi:MAG: molybdopterin-dependent oxidoreductase [Candidatus Nanopelagicales bacterium]
MPDSPTVGSPVGRRIVLGMLGLAALGIAVGSKVNTALSTLAENDPTGLSGLVPGSGHFRIYSVAGKVPPTAPEAYGLRVDGLVRRPGVLSFADLQDLPQTQLQKDVQCVTGWRVNDVRWSGVLVRDVLHHFGLDGGARAVQFGSGDGVYTESLSLDQALRSDVLIATSMDGSEISDSHGGPVRLYVAPMYFYKSIKWLDSITVTDAAVPGFWEQRGYDVDAWVGQSNGRTDAPTA